MAYDEKLAERVRGVLKGKKDITEKKMFGGVLDKLLLIRFDKDLDDKIQKMKHVSPMNLTGKVMRGFVFIGPHGTATASGLRKWAAFALDYARTLPKKKRPLRVIRLSASRR